MRDAHPDDGHQPAFGRLALSGDAAEAVVGFRMAAAAGIGQDLRGVLRERGTAGQRKRRGKDRDLGFSHG